MSKKICFITTVSMTVDQFIRFSFETFHKDGYEIFLICDMDEDYIKNLPDYVHARPVAMGRGIHPKQLFKAISQMKKIFKKEKFDIVQYATPNASFYASIAAKKAKIKVRLYCQWGLLYESFKGIKRFIFKTLEKITCRRSTHVAPDTFGNMELCRKQRFYNEKKSCVIWNGSANGVNLDKFDINQKEEYRREIREKYGIPQDALVVGNVGRVGKDKGFEELMSMIKQISKKYDNAYLLYVGPNEKPETVSRESLEFFDSCDKIIYTGGWVDDTEKYYAAMDAFVFPTYREGFGLVSIEAGAMGVPVVASDIPGPRNALIDGETGYLVPVKGVDKIVDRVSYLFDNPMVRQEMGKNARKRVEDCFDDKVLVKKILEHRNQLLGKSK